VRIALVSRELYPFGGGGIGQFVASAARLLSRVADVTILTTSLFEPEHRELAARADPRLPPGRIVFVPEPMPDEVEAWSHIMHLYGWRVLQALKQAFPEGGPELIEFPDFLGEAFVTLQAARTCDPFLAGSTICVRVHTTGEICDVLDGCVKRDRASRALYAMERFSLAHADRLLWQGGDVLGAYRRFYGDAALAPAQRIRYPYAEPIVDPALDVAHQPSSPLRILYAGRLERRKGIHNLVRAACGLARDDFRLTVVGGDTVTGPLGTSMRDGLELAIADDPRVELAGSRDRASLSQEIRAHDVVAVPSLWECWPYAALEPLHLNRPVLGTPVGGLSELVRAGESGWLADGCGPEALASALERLLADAAQPARLIRAGLPHATGRALSPDGEILDGYHELIGGPRVPENRTSRAEPPPLVSAIVPYYRAAEFVADAVASLVAQTYRRLEIVIVNDGSFEDEDRVLAALVTRHPVRVVTQMNQGLGAARNFGISQSLGRYVFPLDADNAAEPTFVERAVETLERRPEVAYVTAWSRYVDAGGVPLPGHDLGYEPLGNEARLNDLVNVAGDAAAVIRRRVFDAGFAYSDELTSYEDWHLYRELARAGLLGLVIPERLIRYRVRTDSMQAQIARPMHDRLLGEIEARLRENEVRWTSSNA
jgi:glycosyltransferase involved in cell wall biosynthesis